METRLDCFDVTAILSWGCLKLRLIEVEVHWCWGLLNLRFIEVEVDCSWGCLKLRLIEVKVNLYYKPLWNVFEVYSCRLITFILYDLFDFVLFWGHFQGAPKFQGIFFIPPLLEPCKTVPYLNLREISKNLLISSELKGFHANYVKCYSILQLWNYNFCKKSQNCVKAAIAFVCTTYKKQLLFALLQLTTFVCTSAIETKKFMCMERRSQILCLRFCQIRLLPFHPDVMSIGRVWLRVIRYAPSIPP